MGISYCKGRTASLFEMLADQILLPFPFSGGHQGGTLFPAVFVGSVFTAGGDRRRVGVSPGQGLHHIAQLRSQAGHGADAVSNVRFCENFFLIICHLQKGEKNDILR